MMKKLLPAACLALAALPAYADTFWFTYRGLAVNDVYDPNATLQGHFWADDLNSNGVYEASEVSRLVVGNKNYTSCYDTNWNNCQINEFSYTKGGPLTLVAHGVARDPEGIVGTSWSVNTHYKYANTYSWVWDRSHETTWRWNDATSFEVSAVPEPASYAMLGVGLIGVLAAARRRRAA